MNGSIITLDGGLTAHLANYSDFRKMQGAT